MKKLNEISELIQDVFPSLKPIDIGKYAYLTYPHLLPMMKMKVRQYSLSGFGSVFVMDTSMMWLMKLTTLAFTPSEGTSLPFLLVDLMSMGKKRLAYVEFYDCRKEKTEISSLCSLASDYKDIADYKEKDAWYIKERMQGSLIKEGTKKEEEKLYDMVLDATRRYQTCIASADKGPENLIGLKAFQKRMLEEGNPSSSTLEKVLGKEEAVRFFKTTIMPLD